MKLFIVSDTTIGEGSRYDVAIYPFNDLNRPEQRANAIALANDTGGMVYKVTDNAEVVELTQRPLNVYEGLNMRKTKELLEIAQTNGWDTLVTAVQAAIDAAKAIV